MSVCHSLVLFRTLSNSLPVHLHLCDCVGHNDAEHRIPSDAAYSADGRCLLKLKQGISNVISHYHQIVVFFDFTHLYLYIFPHFILSKLTAWSSALFEKLTVPQLVKKSPLFYSTNISIPFYKGSPIVQILKEINSVHVFPTFFFKIHFWRVGKFAKRL